MNGIEVKEGHASMCQAEAVRSKEKQWYGLNGSEKLLFLEAVSKQSNAWQENAAAAVTPGVHNLFRLFSHLGDRDLNDLLSE